MDTVLEDRDWRLRDREVDAVERLSAYVGPLNRMLEWWEIDAILGVDDHSTDPLE